MNWDGVSALRTQCNQCLSVLGVDLPNDEFVASEGLCVHCLADNEERCAICEERITPEQRGNGNVAEMHHPAHFDPGAGGVVHAECGLAAGWVVA